MNEIVRKFLLGEDKFIPEMHLRHSWIYILWTTYKKQKKIQKFKETGDSQYIYQSELDKVCF